MTVVRAEVTDSPLDVAAHIAAVTSATAGAVSTFIGTVRDHDPQAEGTVTGLDYEAHPAAGEFMAAIAGEIDREWADSDVRIAVTHRHGHLAVGDIAVVVACSSAHRREAIDACSGLIEKIKTDLPVWKKQHTDTGSTAWVGI
ncbi:molybdenum cofactor biosynthesis protein MoaE [Corynebacterium mendelii]|uniref:Molybdenum cofactor biosynthesis protein MoaE n=1 Tax=Corynebacterium mendelii TaxID=2765362 RepID=A0A939DYY7_9CORY|nr:molybdenum cofactor biosynthesis protein MoaE [Corynebacterium mendelii]